MFVAEHLKWQYWGPRSLSGLGEERRRRWLLAHFGGENIGKDIGDVCVVGRGK